MNFYIELIYIISGLVLPFVYYPQIRRLLRDRTNLASYSLSKSSIQLALRVPALAFGVIVLSSPSFIFCVALDICGRLLETSAAVWTLLNQGNSSRDIIRRANPFAKSSADNDVAPVEFLKEKKTGRLKRRMAKTAIQASEQVS